MRCLAACAVVGCVILAACTGGGSVHPTPSTGSSGLFGGTLRVGFVDRSAISFDPQRDYSAGPFELFRCCLARTLLSYNGRPVDQGGSFVRPDLASSMPAVSSDGLTWAFHLKRGLHYAPPLDGVEITAPDFVRALVREAALGGNAYSYYYSVIQGFDDYGSGKTDSIAGLSTPDRYTLVVRLVRPEGDLGYLLAMPAAAPIPPAPGRPDAPYGVASGHGQGYGPFFVASGPYMFEGAGAVDLTLPPDRQQPSSGYWSSEPSGTGATFTLVRNPSWNRSTDELRAAYPDRIVGVFDKDVSAQERAAGSGTLDVVLDSPVPSAIAERYGSTDRLRTFPTPLVAYVSMNLAEPPFDDVHVRKAANLVIDRTAILGMLDPSRSGTPATHVAPDSTENDLLREYAPYGATGDLAEARTQMALSRYGNAKGMCTAPACRDIVAPYGVGQCPLLDGATDVAHLIASDLRGIGLDLHLVKMGCLAFYQRISDPTAHVPIAIDPGWFDDFPNGGTLFPVLFSNAAIGRFNYALLGASPDELRRWGYSVHHVPGVDGRIDACEATTGVAQFQCWAGLDTYLMGTVVPWIPYNTPRQSVLLSDRVTQFSWDQFTALAAVDRISIASG